MGVEYSPRDLEWSDRFLEAYLDLDDLARSKIDDAIERLRLEHRTSWARREQLRGDVEAAWIIKFRSSRADIALYWMYEDDNILLFWLTSAPIPW